jgi:hydrogenase expression/formation protein HypC
VCLAIPGQIVAVADDPRFAKVDVGGVRRSIDVGLLDGTAIGDWVLIHVGFALSKISEEQAHEQLELLRSLDEHMLALEEVSGYSFAGEDGERP